MTTPTIQTDRLLLRALNKNDFCNMWYLLKPEIEHFSGPYMPHTENQLKEHIDRINSNTTWGVLLKNETFIGDIGVTSKIDNKIGEMAWYFDPLFWNKGYATEAGRAVVKYMFERLSFIRLCAQIDITNTASTRLAEKLGFDLVAVLPEANLCGKIADIAYYTITL